MSNFPTLTAKPDAENFSQAPAIDPTIRTEFENGYTQTRPRFTAIPKKWNLVYRNMSETDKGLLETFETTTVNYGADSFYWTNPRDSQTYVVRFGAVIEYRIEPANPTTYQVNILLIEAYPNSNAS